MAHYHFIGIGGVGMGPLARLVMARGDVVSGSDVRDNAMVRRLRESGAEVFAGHRARQIGDADVVVFSSSIRDDNPELDRARREGRTVLRRAQLLAELMRQQTAITVAGAHGKTTTTSMVSSLLIRAGLKPTTAVGGVIKGQDWHAAVGDGRYFVAEVDESDGSFLYFEPDFSIITNIDWEHVDHYPDLDAVREAYRRFLGRTRPGGTVIACADDFILGGLLREESCPAVTYGFSDGAGLRACDLRLSRAGSRFACRRGSEGMGEIELTVPGRHTVLNALAAVTLGLELGISFADIAAAMKDFGGVNRRFQLKGEVNGVSVVDDYGHHPTEIRATLQTARQVEPSRLITIFQPHRYSRTRGLMQEFVAALHGSDVLIVTDIYAASEDPIDGIDAGALCALLQRAGEPVTYLPRTEIAPRVMELARPGDLVLTLGAGDIDRIGEDILDGLRRSCPTAGKNLGGRP